MRFDQAPLGGGSGQNEGVAAIAAKLTEAQRDLLGKRGRYFTTEQAMSLPLCDLIERAGSFNRWQRTRLGLAVRAHLEDAR